MTFEVETRKVFILAESMETAKKCGQDNHLVTFHWPSDYTLIDTWDKLGGYHKDNAVIWLAEGYYTHPQYLYVQHLAYTFNIPIVDMNKKLRSPYLMPDEVTLQ